MSKIVASLMVIVMILAVTPAGSADEHLNYHECGGEISLIGVDSCGFTAPMYEAEFVFGVDPYEEFTGSLSITVDFDYYEMGMQCEFLMGETVGCTAEFVLSNYPVEEVEVSCEAAGTGKWGVRLGYRRNRVSPIDGR